MSNVIFLALDMNWLSLMFFSAWSSFFAHNEIEASSDDKPHSELIEWAGEISKPEVNKQYGTSNNSKQLIDFNFFDCMDIDVILSDKT